MPDSVRPHRRQPTRLHHPWDSPGKNTAVGCHFLLQCMKVKSESEVTQSCSYSKWPHGLQPTRLLRPWDFPGKSTGVGCYCLLQLLHYYNIITMLMIKFVVSYNPLSHKSWSFPDLEWHDIASHSKVSFFPLLNQQETQVTTPEMAGAAYRLWHSVPLGFHIASESS